MGERIGEQRKGSPCKRSVGVWYGGFGCRVSGVGFQEQLVKVSGFRYWELLECWSVVRRLRVSGVKVQVSGTAGKGVGYMGSEQVEVSGQMKVFGCQA